MLDGLKNKFHLPEGHYMLSHSVGCLPKTAQRTMQTDFFEPWQHHGGDAWPAWLGAINSFRDQIAGLLNVQRDDVCPQSNLSSGLVKYLGSRQFGHGRKYILMHPQAFPSMGFVASCASRLGLELKLLDVQSDPRDLDVWKQALDEHVAVALITHVHSNSGALSPVSELVSLCQSRQVSTVVDIAQSVGVVPIDVSAWGADIVLGSCVKWLCGGPGAAFMWVNPQLVEVLTPSDVGWFSHQDPFEFDIGHFEYATGALRFWGGTPSVAPFVVASAGIETIREIGVERVWTHNLSLRRRMLQDLSAPDGMLESLPDHGGTLCWQCPAEKIAGIGQALSAGKFYFDQRANTLRLSFHVYNDMQDVTSLVELLS